MATQVWKRKAPAESPLFFPKDSICNGHLHSPKVSVQNKVTHRRYAIEVIQTAKIDEVWLCRSVVGKVANPNILAGLQEAIIRKGVFDITIRFLGGLLVLMEFQSEEVMNSYLDHISWLAQWFSELSIWKPNLRLSERLVWLSINGVPLHCWTVANFNRIGERFGCVISTDQNTSSIKSLTEVEL